MPAGVNGCVHLDVCWIDQRTSLPSGLQQMLLIYPSYIYDDFPTCDVTQTQEEADFQTACYG